MRSTDVFTDVELTESGGGVYNAPFFLRIILTTGNKMAAAE